MVISFSCNRSLFFTHTGENCTTKTIPRDADDPDCAFGLTAEVTCADRGPCFDELCCCDDHAYDNNNRCYDYDECQSNPCKHGGTCFNQHDFYECFCAEGKYYFVLSVLNKFYP